MVEIACINDRGQIEARRVKIRREPFKPVTPRGPWLTAQILRTVEQNIVQADKHRIFRLHCRRDILAAQSLLQRIEAGGLTTLHVAAYQQFAVDHADIIERRRYLGKRPRNLVAATAKQPRFAAGRRDLDTDAIPFPLGCKVIEMHASILKRVGEHEGPEKRAVGGIGPFGPSFAPCKKLGKRRAKRVPHLFDIIDGHAKGLPESGLGEPRRYPHPHAARCKLQQRVATIGIQTVHQFRQHRRSARAAGAVQKIDDFGHGGCDIAAAPVWPHQRYGFGGIANIIAAHAEQHGVETFLCHRTNGSRFDRCNVQRPGKCRQSPTAIGVRCFTQIIGDQPDLQIARSRVDQAIDERSKSLHQPSSSSSRPTRSSARAFN